jgi:Zn-dependent alcohol dehydrogenase
MLAALLTAHNAPLLLAEIQPAGPLEFGQVLVRVLVSGLCGAQLQEIRGEKGGPLPHLMGHEGCGIVEEVGPAVTRVKPGEKVVMHWRKAAGLESPIPKYRFVESVQGEPCFTSGRVTTLATHSICSENRLTPIPADTDPGLGALLGCGLSTALATVESEVRWGQSVLVLGVGGLGLALLAALHLAVPTRLCACDTNERKRSPARCAGADFVNLTDETLTGDFDLILDTTGAPAAMENALAHLAPSGRYVMIGQPAPTKPVCISNARHLFDGEGKTIKATQGGGFRPDLDLPRYLTAVESLYLERLVTHRLPLAKINTALDLVRQGEAGRVLIEMPT